MRHFCYVVIDFVFYLSLQHLLILHILTLLVLLLSGHLWEWASTLPGCISLPGGVAGVAQE